MSNNQTTVKMNRYGLKNNWQITYGKDGSFQSAIAGTTNGGKELRTVSISGKPFLMAVKWVKGNGIIYGLLLLDEIPIAKAIYHCAFMKAQSVLLERYKGYSPCLGHVSVSGSIIWANQNRLDEKKIVIREDQLV